MSDETNILIKTQHLWVSLFGFILTTLTGWKLFLSTKFRQLDSLQKTVDEHVTGEGGCIKSLKNEVALVKSTTKRIEDRVDDIWKHLAENK